MSYVIIGERLSNKFIFKRQSLSYNHPSRFYNIKHRIKTIQQRKQNLQLIKIPGNLHFPYLSTLPDEPLLRLSGQNHF